MNDGTANNKGTAKTENGAKSNQAAKTTKSSSKRDSTRLLHASSANNARKRSKQSMAVVPSSDHAKTPSTADVSNGFGPTNNAMMSGLSIMEKSLQQKARSSNHHNQHHHYHSRSTGRKMLEKSFLSAKRDLSTADAASALASLASSVPSSASAERRGGTKRVGGELQVHRLRLCSKLYEARRYVLSRGVHIFSWTGRYGSGCAVPRAPRDPFLFDDAVVQGMACYLHGTPGAMEDPLHRQAVLRQARRGKYLRKQW